MAWDGNGNFLRLFSWVTDKANGINITASRVDAEDNGFASAGFGNCITRDGQGKATANLTPAAASLYDIGSSGLPWVNGWFTGRISSPNVEINKFKAATTSRASAATQANDPDLVVGLTTAGTYAFELFFSCWNTSSGGTGSLSGNINYSGTFAASPVANMSGWSNNTGGGSFTTPLAIQSNQTNASFGFSGISAGGTGAPVTAYLRGSIAVTGAGTLGFSWAQNVSSAVALNVGIGSYMRVVQLV